MAQTSNSQRNLIDKFQLFSLPEGVDPLWLNNFGGHWEIYKTDSQQSRTKTPENPKLSPVVPNAPIKPRKTVRKLDLIRKKLEYTEPEIEVNSMHSGIVSLPVKSVTSSQKEGRVVGGAKNPEGKQRKISQSRAGKKMPNYDKENDSHLALRLQTENEQSCGTKQSHSAKYRSKFITSKNPSNLLGDFAHIRI